MDVLALSPGLLRSKNWLMTHVEYYRPPFNMVLVFIAAGQALCVYDAKRMPLTELVLPDAQVIDLDKDLQITQCPLAYYESNVYPA